MRRQHMKFTTTAAILTALLLAAARHAPAQSATAVAKLDPDRLIGTYYEISRYGTNPAKPFTQFLTDAKAGNLPAVSFVDGNNLNETADGDDEHPPSEIEIGQHFGWEVVNAVTTSPAPNGLMWTSA